MFYSERYEVLFFSKQEATTELSRTNTMEILQSNKTQTNI